VTPRPLRVGIEGPCCAGKTTMLRALQRSLEPRPVVSVVDYSDFVGGGRFLPPAVPENLQEERNALNTFLTIEQSRTQKAHLLTDPQAVVLIDRSIHTLVAHCFALTCMTGIDYLTLGRETLKASTIPLWPDVVLYMDVTQETVLARNQGKFPADSIFVNAEFNSGVRSYFATSDDISVLRVAWLDGATDARLLQRLAADYVEKSIGTDCDGEAR
jgi:thymidylate kinase